jgi:RNA polymerase sigma factor (sigma-70 family)
MLICLAGGCVIGRRISGRQGGIEVLFDGPDDDPSPYYGSTDTDDAGGNENRREVNSRRSISAYMRDVGRHPLLSKEQETQIFENIGFSRDVIDSLILSTRYGRRKYVSLEGIVANGVKTEGRGNVIEGRKLNECKLGEEEMKQEFYRFLKAVRRVRFPRQGIKVLSSMQHIRLKEGARKKIRQRFYEDLRAYVDIAAERKRGRRSREYIAWIADFGVSPSDASEFYDKFTSLERLLKKDVDKMADSNLRLVVFIAKRYHARGMTLMDFVQEGNIGLLKAIDCFDNGLGYKFATYAPWWINHAIRRSIVDKAATIRYPAHLQETIKKMEGYFKSDPDAAHRQDAEEISAAISIGQSQIELALEAMASRYVESLDEPMGHDAESRTYVTAVVDPHSPNPEEELVRVDFRRKVRDAVYSVLTDRERQVLDSRFADDKQTLKEVGKLTLKVSGEEGGITRERVRQIQQQALKKSRIALVCKLDRCIRGSMLN